MNPSRKTAIIVGVLYMIGTVTGIISKAFIGFSQVTTNENQIIMGALSLLSWVWHWRWFR
jgi:hypothetical protein